MHVSAKLFAQRLNHCLDETDAPASPRERANIISKLLDIPRQQAWSLVAGQQIPSDEIIKRIAEEFEVDEAWLTDNKKL